jgi:glycogen debranching enzyme
VPIASSRRAPRRLARAVVALRAALATRDERLLADCRERAIALLHSNLTRHGMLASAPSPRAAARAYTTVFARDAAICALGMLASEDAELARRAAAGLDTLARRQAANGQIAKFVDPAAREADFWYVGCIDATLWWLLWIDVVDRARGERGLRERYAGRIARAVAWLHAQEHPRFGLLQQNEASDWADIMPRSGFVLYTNALWCEVKRRYRLPRLRATVEHFHALFHPFSAPPPEYRRTKLLAEYAMRGAKDRELYLSFVNFAFAGREGDVLGNVLSIALGLIPPDRAARVLEALRAARVDARYPVRSVCRPIRPADRLWRPYMLRHRQNLAWQYHNGGIWPMIGGFWIVALVQCGRHAEARAELVKLAKACAVADWSFPEWLHGRTYAPRGMPGQSWTAAAFLLAERAVRARRNPLR